MFRQRYGGVYMNKIRNTPQMLQKVWWSCFVKDRRAVSAEASHSRPITLSLIELLDDDWHRKVDTSTRWDLLFDSLSRRWRLYDGTMTTTQLRFVTVIVITFLFKYPGSFTLQSSTLCINLYLLEYLYSRLLWLVNTFCPNFLFAIYFSIKHFRI